jgi:tRNA A-37 threonylcarbamoyl transferase component Bud32
MTRNTDPTNESGSLPTIPSHEVEEKRKADPLLGSNLDGRFLLKTLLGRGGMGRVYLAEDQKLHRRVALKLMDPQLSEDSAFRARFRREAVLQAQVTHPGIVQVIDLGECPEGAYIVLEFSDGRNLSSILRSGPLTVETALDLFEQMLDVVDFAHQNGIIHRDLKPTNILIEERGSRKIVRVLDFGIAKLLVRDSEPSRRDMQMTLTQAGTGIGTPGYVSFEQATGGKVDHRTDVFALGCILYQMLTGVLPHPSTSLSDYMVSLAKNEVRPLAETHKKLAISAEIDHIVRKALARDPEHRTSSVAELLAESRAVRNGVFAPTVTLAANGTPAMRKGSRNLIAVGALLLGVALAAPLVWMQHRGRLEAEKAAGNARTQLSAQELAVSEARTALNAAGVSADDALKDAVRGIAGARDAAVRERDELKSTIATLESSATREKLRAEAAEKTIVEKGKEIAALGEKVERLEKDGGDTTRLRDELRGKETEVAKLTGSLQAKADEVARITRELETAKAELAKKTEELAKSGGDQSGVLAALRDDLRRKDQELTRTLGEVSTLRQQLINAEAVPVPQAIGGTLGLRVKNGLRGQAVVVKEVVAVGKNGESTLRLPQDRELLAGTAMTLSGAPITVSTVRVVYQVRKSDKSLDGAKTFETQTLLWKAGELLLEIGGS